VGMSTLFVAFEDFILSRQAALCSPETIDFYRRMLEPFLALADGGRPSNRLVREFLSTVAQRGVSSATVHALTRAVRAFLRSAHEEAWIDEPVTARMPRVDQSRVEVLRPEEARRVPAVCGFEDRAWVMTQDDSALRRGEASALNCDDVGFHTRRSIYGEEGGANPFRRPCFAG